MSMQPMGLDQRLQLMEMELQNLRQRNGGAMQMASAPMGFNHFAPQFMDPPSVQMTPRQPEENVDPQEVDRRKKAHQEMLALHHDLLQSHTSLQKQHADLMKAHKELLHAFKNASFNAGGGAAGAAAAAKKMVKHPALGVVRLDYDYPPAPGDSDHPASFGYDVYFRCVPGLSFEMCQTGQFTEEVERRFADAIKHLEARGVSAITGDCGFMMAFQVLARKIAAKPIFMSSMVQCPIIAAALDPDDQIMVLTANEHSLKPQKEILMTSFSLGDAMVALMWKSTALSSMAARMFLVSKPWPRERKCPWTSCSLASSRWQWT